MSKQEEPNSVKPAAADGRRRSARAAAAEPQPADQAELDGGGTGVVARGSRRFGRLPSLPSVEATSNTLRAVLLNLSFFIAFFLVLPALATQLWKNQVVIEPIAVPETLVQMGLKPEVAANRLWDGLHDLVEEAQTSKATFVAVPRGQNLDFSLPQSGVSVTSIMSQIRQFLNLYETHVSGEFLCGTPACEPEHMRLRLRVMRETATIIDLPEIGPMPSRDYFRLAAEGVFNQLDPFISIAALARNQPERAIVLARQLVRSRHPDSAWAHNLIGEIDMNQGRYAEAIAEFESALAIDATFLEARVNRGLGLGHQGRFEEAERAVLEAQRSSPSSVAAAKALASLAYMRGDKLAAVGLFLKAAELEPAEPRHLVLAGSTEIDLGMWEAGEGHLKEALSVAPGDPGALEALGNLYYGKYGAGRNIGSAITMYRNWAQYDPDNSQAWFHLGNAQVSNRQFEEALASYDKAMALGDTDGRIKVVRAGALMGLALAGVRPLGEPIAAFEALQQAEPPEPTVFLSLGKLYEGAGDKDKALAAYRRFLELVPPEHEQRKYAEERVARLIS